MTAGATTGQRVPPEAPRKQYGRLTDRLRKQGPCAVAFSGGLDSAFLLLAAREALGERVLAVTAEAVYMAQWELEEAAGIARGLGVSHLRLDVAWPEAIRRNPPDRCYRCKRHLMGLILAEARTRGFPTVLDGTNAEDAPEDRPGMRALRELGIVSPLRELGWTKADIRAVSRARGLTVWDKPPYACLLTRLPHGRVVTAKGLRRIEAAERHLARLGFRAVRVRSHGDLARLEAAPADLERLLDADLRRDVHRTLQGLGFRYVSLDLEGYRSGSMNRGGKKREPE